ncbi:MAG: hypothetical protein JXB13_07190 [Phycisphaerae bacterium]|nr:hypothetical protein [Phycisphaerae bacterium]
MTNSEPTPPDTTEAREIAKQAEVEIAILLGIEETLRIALQWMTRGRGNAHKLSTLRFHAWSFERHLTRIQVLADHGGYLHLITNADPHLAGEVGALRDERARLHAALESIIIRLDRVSRDDAGEFGQLCADLERFLDALRTHGRKERALLQGSFTQEEAESG